MADDLGRVPLAPGSHASHGAGQAVSALTGFDPSRDVENAIATMGARIEARRKAIGLTLEQLGERSGMSKSYIWEIENGRNKNPTIRTAYNIAGALGWTLSECVGLWEHASLLHPEAMRIAVQVDMLVRATQAREQVVLATPSDSDGSGEAGETGTGSTEGNSAGRDSGIAR